MLDSPDAKADPDVETAPSEMDPPRAQFLGVLERRRSVSSIKLVGPGPNANEIARLLTIALRVPDHGPLEPWRIILVQGSAREELGGKLAAALLDADTRREPAGVDLAVRKIKAVLTAPLVVIVVSCADASARIPEWEQLLSAGAVCMNLITTACALGYGSIWLTGWAAYHPAALTLLGVRPNEKVAGIIPIGMATERPAERSRPSLERLVTTWVAP